jgi:hypothetical protein
MSRTARAIAASAALMFSLHMVSLHGQGKASKPAPAPHAAKTTTKVATGKHTTTRQQSPKTTTAKAPKGTSAKSTTKLAKHSTEKTKPVTKSASAKTEKKDAMSVKKASMKKADTTKTKKDATTKQAAKKTTSDTTTATTEATSTTPPLENLSPVQQKLAKNTKLASKLEARLPAGTNLVEAADGFRNLGQFVAAVNVSNNLGIPFDKLKADMVEKKMSLGQSIQDLRPMTGSPTVEAQHAEYDANSLIVQTEQEMSVTVSTKITTTTTPTTSTTSTTSTTPTTSTSTGTKPRKSRKSLTGGL